MILVDTSVWIGHFRSENAELARILGESLVLTHPFVTGELACGGLRNRGRVLTDLHALPSATPATHTEVMRLVEDSRLWGSGIGWTDAHLLASALLSNCWLWTQDGPLHRAAGAAGVKSFPRSV